MSGPSYGDATMDITVFHELMQRKYAENRLRHRRFLRMWILCGMAPAASLLSFVLAYNWYAGR